MPQESGATHRRWSTRHGARCGSRCCCLWTRRWPGPARRLGRASRRRKRRSSKQPTLDSRHCNVRRASQQRSPGAVPLYAPRAPDAGRRSKRERWRSAPQAPLRGSARATAAAAWVSSQRRRPLRSRGAESGWEATAVPRLASLSRQSPLRARATTHQGSQRSANAAAKAALPLQAVLLLPRSCVKQ